MSNTFTWLHLSDLHWGTENIKNYWANIKDEFFEDLKKLTTESNLKIDALFFTGDLVNRGNEYQELNNGFLNDLENHFSREGMSPLFIPVPGNHDLMRPTTKDDSFIVIKDNWESKEDIRNRIWQKQENTGTWGVIQKAFQNYTTWLNDSNRPLPLPSNITHGLLPGDIACTIPLEGGRSIGVIGLNSAFLQLDGGDYTGKLDIHISQLRALCGDDYTSWFKNHTLSFLLTHHPVSWLSSRGEDQYLQEINRNGRFLFHFCGHMHENEYYRWQNSFSSSSWKLWMGTSLFSVEKYILDWGVGPEAHTDRRHGYSLGSLDSSKEQGRLWPRRVNKNRNFVQDTDLATERPWVNFHYNLRKDNIAPTKLDNRNTTPEFLEKLEKQLIEIFSRPLMKEFIKSLLEIMVKEKEANGVIRDLLVSSPIKELIESVETILKQNDQGNFIPGDNVAIDDSSVKAMALFIIGLGCLEAIILLIQGYERYKEIYGRKEENRLMILWGNCKELIEWLILLTVDHKWIKESKASLGKEYLAVVVSIPVKTDIGCEIYFAALNERKAAFCRGLDGAIAGTGVIPVASLPIQKTGWMCEEIVRHIVKDIYLEVEKAEMPADEGYDTARKVLQSRLKVRKRTGKNPVYVVIKEWKLHGNPLKEVTSAINMALNTLDIGSIKSGQETGTLVESEEELDGYIREFFTLIPTGENI